MPLREIDGRRFATYWVEVVMPRDLYNVGGPEKRYESFIRSAPLDDLQQWIRTFVDRQTGPWCHLSIQAQAERPARTWSISGDGRCVLDSRRAGSSLPSRDFQIDPDVLFHLGYALATQDRDGPFLPAVLDSSECGGVRGTLEVRWGDEVRAIPIKESAWEPSSDEDASRYGRLLRAWAGLYEEAEATESGEPPR
jgi:hypothetical protein